MADLDGATDLLGRVRRDLDRNLLRARNGLRLLSATTPPVLGASARDLVWRSGKVELWRYRSDTRSIGTPLLLVHSLVSRSYVMDLTPGNSFVEHLLRRGFDVFLVVWGEPDELEAGNDLSTYADDLLPIVVREVAGIGGSGAVTMFGYCFGGVLALLYAAGHSDGPVTSLAVMATPIDFDHMPTMTAMLQNGRVEPASILDRTGNAPAEVIRSSFRFLQPTADVTSYVNLWEHLWDDEFVAAHQVMTAWGNDHIPFPGAAFLETAQLFARENRLATGRVPVGGREVDLADISVPFLNILGEKDHIVPPEAVGPLSSLVGSEDKEELRLPSGHVGLIVGRGAHARNIPVMADWLERHSDSA
jgi:polyhydroxyalkanoate synthase